MTEERSWELCYKSRGWSLNRERTWHYHQRNKIVTEWRKYYKQLALDMKIPHLDRIRVEVFTTFGTRALQDPANNLPAVKAAIDGLTARVHKDGWSGAGIIDDDSADYVDYIRFWAPTYVKGEDSVCLVITESL